MIKEGIKLYDKNEIIKMYQEMGEPEIDREVLMKIRVKYPYGLMTLKSFLINYLRFNNEEIRKTRNESN